MVQERAKKLAAAGQEERGWKLLQLLTNHGVQRYMDKMREAAASAASAASAAASDPKPATSRWATVRSTFGQGLLFDDALLEKLEVPPGHRLRIKAALKAHEHRTLFRSAAVDVVAAKKQARARP